MEDIISPSDKQVMVSKFLEIVAGQSADTVRQFLQVLIPILKPTGYTSADPYKICSSIYKQGSENHEIEHWKIRDDGNKNFCYVTGHKKHGCIYVATNVTITLSAVTDICCCC
ncbi:uncharacterized protein LOC110709088 isoform X1 [Chenopodium quinoa]|uniref:uncharacterized protein LOC110709088 isoform X1 n=1 Tax=Chenopodium quinoa TaxID=63459 RepID=UPI000B785300|nr:uncharacterized protein LOC110709088 isoform X1 [Chenopodium quinoa]